MKKHLQIIFITCLLALNVFVAYSQEDEDTNPLDPGKTKKPFFIGPTVGINSVFHTVNLHTFSDNAVNVANCPVFTSGKSTGFYVGINTEFHLGDVVNSKSGIIVRLLYNTMPASFEKDGDTYPSILIINNVPTEKFSTVNHKNEVKYSTLTLEAQYKLNLFESGFGVAIGPTIDYAMTKTQDQTMNLISPSNATFSGAKLDPTHYSNNGTTYTPVSGDIPNSSSIRVGLKFGALYEITMKNMMIVPHAYYNLGLTDLSSSLSWRVSAFQVGVDFRYGFKF